MRSNPDGAVSRRRLLLLAVAGLLSLAALLAVGILLFGRFGRTEGRILATTALLAGFGLAALPGAVLLDRGRLRPLAGAVIALAAVGCALSLGTVWSSGPPDWLGRSMGTATFFLVATSQTAALAARRDERDPGSVRRLLPASTATAYTAAALASGLVWAGTDAGRVGRVVAALVVLDVLAAALQPLLARARPLAAPVHLRLLVDAGETIDLHVEAPDLASACARAIRDLERQGRHVLLVEAADRSATFLPAPPASVPDGGRPGRRLRKSTES